MLKKMIFAAMAAVAVIGCNEKDVEMPDVQNGEKIQLTVNLPQAATKVTGAPTDDKVNNVQIFVFDKNGL